MWELECEESWEPKNWWFWTVVLEKTLESPLDCRRSNQSILKEISPGISLEAMMLKLKLQYFGHLMQRVDSLEKTLMLGGIGGRRRGQQRMRWLDGITDSTTWVWVNSGSWWWTDTTKWLNWLNWTDLLINNKQVQIYLYKYKNINKIKILNISLNNSASQYI